MSLEAKVSGVLELDPGVKAFQELNKLAASLSQPSEELADDITAHSVGVALEAFTLNNHNELHQRSCGQLLLELLKYSERARSHLKRCNKADLQAIGTLLCSQSTTIPKLLAGAIVHVQKAHGKQHPKHFFDPSLAHVASTFPDLVDTPLEDAFEEWLDAIRVQGEDEDSEAVTNLAVKLDLGERKIHSFKAGTGHGTIIIATENAMLVCAHIDLRPKKPSWIVDVPFNAIASVRPHLGQPAPNSIPLRITLDEVKIQMHADGRAPWFYNGKEQASEAMTITLGEGYDGKDFAEILRRSITSAGTTQIRSSQRVVTETLAHVISANDTSSPKAASDAEVTHTNGRQATINLKLQDSQKEAPNAIRSSARPRLDDDILAEDSYPKEQAAGVANNGDASRGVPKHASKVQVTKEKTAIGPGQNSTSQSKPSTKKTSKLSEDNKVPAASAKTQQTRKEIDRDVHDDEVDEETLAVSKANTYKSKAKAGQNSKASTTKPASKTAPRTSDRRKTRASTAHDEVNESYHDEQGPQTKKQTSSKRIPAPMVDDADDVAQVQPSDVLQAGDQSHGNTTSTTTAEGSRTRAKPPVKLPNDKPKGAGKSDNAIVKQANPSGQHEAAKAATDNPSHSMFSRDKAVTTRSSAAKSSKPSKPASGKASQPKHLTTTVQSTSQKQTSHLPDGEGSDDESAPSRSTIYNRTAASDAHRSGNKPIQPSIKEKQLLNQAIMDLDAKTPQQGTRKVEVLPDDRSIRKPNIIHFGGKGAKNQGSRSPERINPAHTPDIVEVKASPASKVTPIQDPASDPPELAYYPQAEDGYFGGYENIDDVDAHLADAPDMAHDDAQPVNYMHGRTGSQLSQRVSNEGSPHAKAVCLPMGDTKKTPFDSMTKLSASNASLVVMSAPKTPRVTSPASDDAHPPSRNPDNEARQVPAASRQAISNEAIDQQRHGQEAVAIPTHRRQKATEQSITATKPMLPPPFVKPARRSVPVAVDALEIDTGSDALFSKASNKVKARPSAHDKTVSQPVEVHDIRVSRLTDHEHSEAIIEASEARVAVMVEKVPDQAAVVKAVKKVSTARALVPQDTTMIASPLGDPMNIDEDHISEPGDTHVHRAVTKQHIPQRAGTPDLEVMPTSPTPNAPAAVVTKGSNFSAFLEAAGTVQVAQDVEAPEPPSSAEQDDPDRTLIGDENGDYEDEEDDLVIIDEEVLFYIDKYGRPEEHVSKHDPLPVYVNRYGRMEGWIGKRPVAAFIMNKDGFPEMRVDGKAADMNSDDEELEEGDEADADDIRMSDHSAPSSDIDVVDIDENQEPYVTTVAVVEEEEDPQYKAYLENLAWEKALEPHQREYRDAHLKMHRQLMDLILNSEKSTLSVISDYEKGGLGLISRLEDSHVDEADEYAANQAAVCTGVKESLKSLVADIGRDQRQSKELQPFLAEYTAQQGGNSDAALAGIDQMLELWG